MRADPMRPVRLPDVPGVVWTIAWAFAGARLPGPVRLAVAVASLPMWALLLLCLPGLHHGADHRVVARLTPRTPQAAARTAARFALFLLVVAALTAALIAGLASATLAGAVVVVVVCAGVLATATALLISQLAVVTTTSATTTGGTPAAAGATAGDKDADQRRWKSADWQVDCVASRLPTGGLAFVHQHVRALVPPGATVRVQAASARHADVYARYGLRPLPTKPLRLVTRDAGAQPAHGNPQTTMTTGDDTSRDSAAPRRLSR